MLGDDNLKTFLLSAAIAVTAMAADAAQVVYDFTTAAGTRIYTGDEPANAVSEAALALGGLSGTITFDDTLLRTESGTSGASGTFTRSVFAGPILTVDGLDTSPLTELDEFRVEKAAFADLYTGIDSDLATGEQTWTIYLFDYSKSLIPNTLPFPDDLDLADFDSAVLSIYSASIDDRVDFQFTSLVRRDAPVVPLPAALPLLLAGLGGMAAVGRRTR